MHFVLIADSFQCIDIKILTLLNYKLSDKNVIQTLSKIKKIISRN